MSLQIQRLVPVRTVAVIAVVTLTLLGLFLRLPGLFGGELHGDESLFATWARLIGTWRDPLLSGQMIDKPPLQFYLQAGLYPMLATPALWVSRLPGLFASVLMMPLTARLVWNLFDDDLAAVLATTVIACSPLLVQYGATALLDPLMGCLVLASLVSASKPARNGRRTHAMPHTFMAGLLMGVALMTKYQAALFLPLHVLVALMSGHRREGMVRWLIGFVLPILAGIIWLAARGGSLDLWGRQMESFGGLRMAWSWELWSRLEAWGASWAQLLGSPVLAFALLLFLPVFLALLIQNQDRHTAYDQLIVLFLVAYGLLHWFVAVPVWNRYLIAVAPLAAIALGRFVSRVIAFLQPAVPLPVRYVAAGVVLAFALLMTPSGVEARQAHLDGAGSARQSIETISYMLQEAPHGTVLYDHWFSWQWRYSLLDSGVYVSWFPHPQALMADLHAFLDGDGERYLVLPRAPEAEFVHSRLSAAGFTLEVVLETPQMVLYRIRA